MKKIFTIFSMVVMIACIMCSSASAASYPPACDPSAMGDNATLLVYATYDGSYEAYGFHPTYAERCTFTWNGHQVVAKNTHKTEPVYFYKYVYKNGAWSKNGTGQITAGNSSTLVNIGWEVYASDFSIYDTDGELFFPKPPSLPEVVQELTEEGSQSLGVETVGVMKTLVPFGVGCLALLTGLVLLSRKLPIFLR